MSPAGATLARRPLKPLAAAVTPPAVSANLLIWVRADAGTVYKDSGGTPATVSGDTAYSWDSSVPVSFWHPLVTPTNPNFGTYQTNQVNGKPCVRFPGNACMSSAFTLNTGFDIFIVCKPITWVTSTFIVSSGSGDSYGALQTGSTPNVSVYNGASIGGGNTGLVLGTWALLETGGSTTQNAFLKVNNNAATNGGNLTVADRGGFVFAGHSGPSSFCNIDIAEILAYDAVLSASDATTVRSYVTNRYGFP